MANLATITTNILADSGIDDINVIVSTGSYADPAWITSLAWTKITGAPANIVTGTGTTNYLPKFTGTSTIGNSVIQEASGFIGIGVSPSSNIDILGSSSRLRLDGTSSSFQILSRNTANSTTNPIIFDADTYTYNRGGVFRMLLDSSGNLGLGVTPSAWSASWTAQQFGQAGSLFAFKSGSNYTVLSNNSYAIGGGYQSGDARYINNGLSTAYIQNNSGQHLWMTAPSGTAGNAISFTQAMTLDASGNLGIGIPNPSNRLQITAAAGSSHARWTESATTVGFVGGAQGIITGHNGKFAVRAESGLVLSGSGNSADVVIASGGAATFSSSVTASRYTSIGSSSYTNDFVNTNIGTVGQTVGIRFGYDGSTYNKGAVYFISKSANGVGDLIFALNNSESSANVSTSDERMRLTSSGNLGLGVTPSAWGSLNTSLDFTYGSLYRFSNTSFGIAGNAFYNGSNWIYKLSQAASDYFLESGQHIWRTAPSGTAGNAISFTQAMTLGSNSGLSIGTPSAAPAQGLLVQGASTFSDTVTFNGSNNVIRSGNELRFNRTDNLIYTRLYDAGSTFALDNRNGNGFSFQSAGTNQMVITSNGNVGIRNTNPDSFDSFARQLVVGDGTTNQGITIFASTTTESSLYFADGTGAASFRGYIYYRHSNDSMFFGTNAANALTLASTGAATFSSSVTIQNGNSLTLLQSGNGNGSLIRSVTNGDFRITTGGTTDAFTITNGGNVLIGTTTDAGFKLDVNGTGRFSGGGSNGYLYVSGNAGAGGSTNPAYLQGMNFSWNKSNGGGESLITYTGAGGGSNIRFGIGYWNNSTYSEQLSITSGGNVGIGITNPQADLHVFRSGSTGSITTGLKVNHECNADDYVVFFTGNESTLSNRFVMTQPGNVGIGTTSPTSKLDVFGEGRFNVSAAGNTTTTALTLVNTTDDVNNGVRIAWKPYNASFETAYITTIREGANAFSSLVFATSTNGWGVGGPTERMRIFSDGNVFIGSSPSNSGARLEVVGSTTEQIRVRNSGGGGGGIIGTDTSGNLLIDAPSNIYFQALSGTNTTIIGTVGQIMVNSSSNSTFTGTGNVLIGTTSDNSNKLRVNGVGFFDQGIRTGNPYGSTTNNVLIGRFLTETASVNGSIRVQIGTRYYNIAAQDLGEVPT
jgi:hypothetical protein